MQKDLSISIETNTFVIFVIVLFNNKLEITRMWY